MKKIIALILSLTMVIGALSLVGCGSKDEDGSSLGNAKEGILTVGLDDTFAPMGFRTEKGELVGFDIDLANEVGKTMGLKVKFQPIKWESKDLELKSKKIDCIWNGLSVTPERIEAMSLSNKYLDNTIILMTMKKNVKVDKEEDLAKYKIATQEGSSALDALKGGKAASTYTKNIQEYEDYDACILALKSGRADVVAIDQVIGEYKKKQGVKLMNCKYSLGKDAYAIGFRKEDTALKDAVNDAIKKAIDAGTTKKISEKWFGKDLVIFEEIK